MLNRVPIQRYKPHHKLSPELSRAIKLVLWFSFEMVCWVHEAFTNPSEPNKNYGRSWYYYNVIDIIKLAISKLDNDSAWFSYKDTLSNIHYIHTDIPNFIWLLIQAVRKIED